MGPSTGTTKAVGEEIGGGRMVEGLGVGLLIGVMTSVVVRGVGVGAVMTTTWGVGRQRGRHGSNAYCYRKQLRRC